MSTAAAPLCGGALVCGLRFFSPTGNEPSRTATFIDRSVYFADDPVAHIVVSFVGASALMMSANRHIEVRVTNAAGGVAGQVTLPAAQITQPDFEFFLDLQGLALGNFTVNATLSDPSSSSAPATASTTFSRVRTIGSVNTIPAAGIPIHVGAQSASPGARWPVSAGIPLPEGALFDPSRMALFENGILVPVQVTTRATWRPQGGSIKWLGLDFTTRYDGVTPRTYVLKLVPAGSPPPTTRLRVSQTATHIVVNTGKIRFRVDRRHFAGIEEIGGDRLNTGLPDGPFLVDETNARFTAARDTLPVPASVDHGVEVEESGSQRVTIRGTGWYVSAAGQKLCKFVTRISAYANQPFVRISQRTLITYDTRNDRIRDLGWQVTTKATHGTFAFGREDTSPFVGAVPRVGDAVFLHQEKADAFRIVTSAGGNLGGGLHAEGWISVRSGPGASPTTLAIRDIYQKFPKELEIENVRAVSGHPGLPQGGLRLVAHFWPKHGRNVFLGAPTDTSREDVYKLRYAHQGALLQLQPPPDYRTAVTTYLSDELGNPDSDGEITGMNAANGQGLAIGNELLLIVHSPGTSVDQIRRDVALFREDPQAIAAPAWNAASRVLGQLSAADPSFDPDAERAIEIAGPSYLRGIVEAGDEFGMWVYGNIHDNWDPSTGRPLIHRVWSASHYQNVWGDWLLYFRGGKPDQLRWARVHSDHHMDIDTNNFDDGTSLHGRAGYMYHVKGFVPWGGDSGLFEHWINPSAFLLRYDLTGDRRAFDLARTWFAVAGPGVVAPLGPVDPTLPCSAWANSFFRDRVTYLGELTEYYQATWDPHALMALSDESRNLLDVPFECTGSAADHPIWTRQWFSRYYDLTHDPRVVQRFVAWSAAGFDDLTVNSFLYRTTGNQFYVQRMLPGFYDAERIYYDSPGERYHGYGGWVAATGAIWLQQAPYFLQAVKSASLPIARGDKRVTYPGMATYFPISGGPAGLPARAWSDSSVVVVAYTQPGTPLNVSMDALRPFGDPRGQFFVLAPPSPPAATSVFVPSNLLFSQEYFFNSSFPLTFQQTNAPPGLLYRVEVRADTPRIFAPYTNLAEATVLRRRFFGNGCEHQSRYRALDRQFFYFSPLRPHSQSIVLRIGAANGKDEINPISSLPVYYRIESDTGTIVKEGRLFLYGSRSSEDVVLTIPSPPPVAQPAWSLYTTSNYGPRLELHDGAEELVLSVKRQDLATIWAALPQVTTTPILSCP